MKRMFIPPEHAEQVTLVAWWEMQARIRQVDVELLFAIPNGGNRNAATGARLKAEGVRAGIPDLMLAIPRQGYGGLFIELKRRHGGKLGARQKDMLGKLTRAGYAAVVCRGFEEAWRAICRYLGWEYETRNRSRAVKEQGLRPWENWGEVEDDTIGNAS